MLFICKCKICYRSEMTQQKGRKSKIQNNKIQLNSQAGRVPSTAAVLPRVELPWQLFVLEKVRVSRFGFSLLAKLFEKCDGF